jgi:hypothetical protein
MGAGIPGHEQKKMLWSGGDRLSGNTAVQYAVQP